MKLPPYLDPSGSDWVQAPTKSCGEHGKVIMTDGMGKRIAGRWMQLKPDARRVTLSKEN